MKYDAMIEEAKELLKKIYEKYPSGGAMHVVLDDGNFETRCIVWCLVNAVPEVEEPDRSLFVKISGILLDMPEKQRYKVWQ